LLAAVRLGVERAWVLEDSAAGIASGKAAGFEVIAVKHPREVAGMLREILAGTARTAGVE
jgi:beta-phosphoglucomutase-like phosphatase (HAD superfamily)